MNYALDIIALLLFAGAGLTFYRLHMPRLSLFFLSVAAAGIGHTLGIWFDFTDQSRQLAALITFLVFASNAWEPICRNR